MKKKFYKITQVALAVVFLLFCFSNCAKPAVERRISSDALPSYRSFRDVPGITASEIEAIEYFRIMGASFVYGMPTLTESFTGENGKAQGFTVLFCDWLSEIFGFPFYPVIYRGWSDFIEGMQNGDVDFTGTLTANEERRQVYFMTDTIASRPMKYFRIAGSAPLTEIARSRPVRYVMLEGTTTIGVVQAASEPGTYEIIPVSSSRIAYDLLKNGEADAYISEAPAEAAFDVYGDVVLSDFYPLFFETVSLATQKPELEPIISVVQKILDSGGVRYLTKLYDQGHHDYRRHKLFLMLNDEEREYLRNNPVATYGPYASYPHSFYNTREHSWQGIFFDLLDELTILTGLAFEPVGDQNTPWVNTYQMLLNGEAAFIPNYVRTRERAAQGLLIWPETAILTDYYALLSKLDYPNITVNEIPHVRVGLVWNSDYAHKFRNWFPDHTNTFEYMSMDEAFDALQRGEVDVVMATQNRLLQLTNYLELPSYKVNVMFGDSVENRFAFNKDEVILCSIIDKALGLIDIEVITNQWVRRTFDYRAKVAEAQRPWFVGAAILLFLVLVLLFVLYRKTRNTGRQLKDLVAQRTSELEAALVETKKATERTMLMFNKMPLGCILWDTNGNMIDCNEEVLRLLNIPDKQTFFDKFYEFAPEYQPDGRRSDTAMAECNERAFAEGYARFEMLHQLRDGQPVPMEITLVRIEYNNGDAVIAYSRDLREHKAMLAEIKKVQDDLRQARDIAEESSKAKSKFLATMSHEIRTPMNSIVGFSELALDDKIPAKTRDYLNKIMLNSEWLLQIINDILDISKIESGKMELEYIPFDLHELFVTCRTIITPKAEEKGIDLHFYAEPSIGKKLLGDPIRLRQVLLNIISNAVKFTNPGGSVKVAATVNGLPNGNITINFEVRDSGIGMSPEQITKVAEPFIQAEAGITRKYGGTGLGLAISRSIVEMMGSELIVESTLGVGSKFSFELTFDTVEAPANSTEPSFLNVQSDRPLFDGEILLCEDSQMNQEVLCDHLKRVGLTTDVAENGREGFNMVRRRLDKGEKPYDLIFMDIHMPIMDGIAATALINELNTGTPIVAMTANIMSHDREQYLQNGMKDCIGKPFVSQELWRCLLKFLKPREWQTENKTENNQSDENLLNKLLSNFVKDNQSRYNEIAAAIETGDIVLANRLAHTLKSNAALIGKTKLQKVARDVESLLESFEESESRQMTEQLHALERELSAVLEELTPIVRERTPPAPVEMLEPEAMRELLVELKPLLESGNPDCLEYIEQLRGVPGSDKLIEQMENLDFEKAMETLTRLI